MSKKSATTAEISSDKVEIQASEIQVESSAIPAEENQPETQRPQTQQTAPRVHLQNRRCCVYLFKEPMPDGKTVRIVQILDSPVDFSSHPNFISGLNTLRNRCFGEEEGRLYVTKNVPIPEENRETTVFFAYIHTKTGAISGEKAFTTDEARAHLTKVRNEIQQWRERRRAAYHKPPTEFGSELGAAIRNAQEQQSEEKIASN